MSKYASKTLSEYGITIGYIGLFLTQLKTGVLRCKNAIPKLPPKKMTFYVFTFLCLTFFLSLSNCCPVTYRSRDKNTLDITKIMVGEKL